MGEEGTSVVLYGSEDVKTKRRVVDGGRREKVVAVAAVARCLWWAKLVAVEGRRVCCWCAMTVQVDYSGS